MVERIDGIGVEASQDAHRHRALDRVSVVKDQLLALFDEVEAGNIYFDVIKDVLKSRIFDILGHLDIYRRYGEDFFGPEIHSLWKPHIDELCRIMKAQGVGYEINTSSIRRGFLEPMPEGVIVEAMNDRGVNTVIVGSDAHQPSEVGGGIVAALDLLRKNGINELTVFSRRRGKRIDIHSNRNIG